MSAELAHELHEHAIERRRTLRARIVLGLGPATALAGVVWALVQPYRLIFLHPHGDGFWWLVGGEAPLYVVLAGIVFWRVVAVPLAEDLESGDLRGHGQVPSHPADGATPAEAAQ